MPTLAKPSYTPGIGRHVFDWNGTGVRIEISRVDDDGVGEICIYGGKEASELLHLSKINLLSTRGCAEVAKRVTERQAFDWDDALVYVAALTMKKLREGEPIIKIGKKPQALKREYLLHPILPLNQPTTIYAPGGEGKSNMAMYIGCLVQYQIASPLGWSPLQGNVLYLDWEDDQATQERRLWAIKQGLNVPDEIEMDYWHCSRPLLEMVDEIARAVSERSTSLIIIDSAMAAMATNHRYGGDPSEPVSAYYNALRYFRTTTLTIDHVTKNRGEPGDTHNSGPYGSVVKTNRVRNQYELTADKDKGIPVIRIKMVHTKINEGMLQRDKGIQVTYINDENGNAEQILFEPFDLTDSPKFVSAMPLREQAINVLRRGNMKATVLAEEMGLDKTKHKSLFSMLNHWNGRRGGFVKLDDDSWGLYTEEVST